MKQLTVSVIHSLKLIPADRLTAFARIHSRVILSTNGTPEDAEAVPGSIQISTTSDNGVIKKILTFERPGVSDRVADILESYKCRNLIAVYTDENGNNRVVGSPLYPLSLDYTTQNGVYVVTLSGEDTAQDGYLAQ